MIIYRILNTIISFISTFIKCWSLFMKSILNYISIIEFFIRRLYPIKKILSFRYSVTIFGFILNFHSSVCIIGEFISSWIYIFTNFITLDIIISLLIIVWFIKVPLLDRSIIIKNDIFSAPFVPVSSKLTLCNQISLLVITLSTLSNPTNIFSFFSNRSIFIEFNYLPS